MIQVLCLVLREIAGMWHKNWKLVVSLQLELVPELENIPSLGGEQQILL